MSSARQFCQCDCYFRNNYFLDKINLHVEFTDEPSFVKMYGKVLLEDHKLTEQEIRECILLLEKEKERRTNAAAESYKRKKIISETHEPLHKEIYCLKESFLAEEFLQIVEHCKNGHPTTNSAMKLMNIEKAERAYSFPVFTEDFCKLFIEEIEHFERSDLPKGRPNTMNNYGVLLDELGFYEHFITPLREEYLIHICGLLYPELGGGQLDSHKAFIVTYKSNQDVDLALHYDNAEITLNVSLGKDFDDGSLYFGKMRQEHNCQSNYIEIKHTCCHGILHRGQHMHGAMPITEGERYNLIIWMRSSVVRNLKCPMCDCKPELVETLGYGDGFTQETIQLCTTV